MVCICQIGERATIAPIFRLMVDVTSPTNQKSLLPTIHSHAILSLGRNSFCHHFVWRGCGVLISSYSFSFNFVTKIKRVEVWKSKLSNVTQYSVTWSGHMLISILSPNITKSEEKKSLLQNYSLSRNRKRMSGEYFTPFCQTHGSKQHRN